MKSTLLLLIFAGVATAAPIAITDNKGRTITVEVLRIGDGQAVVQKPDGKQATIALAGLTKESREAVIAAAAAKPGEFRIGLKAQTVAAGRSTDRKWETTWGSYDKTIYQSRTVSTTVTAGADGQVTLEILWIGSEAGRAANRGVVLTESRPLDLKANTPQTATFDALFVEDDAKYVALGIRDQYGYNYAGWAVRVVDARGTVLDAQGSRPPMVELVKGYMIPDDAEEEAE